LSGMMCPYELWVCPIREHGIEPARASAYGFKKEELLKVGFECVDFYGDLESCGGCGSIDIAHDCTAIPHARGVGCVMGQCLVDSCDDGFRVGAGRNACVRA
ncbi:hypothetical protein BV25DRAFT_1808884, partial [Artomyces pyxidatus]